jgi:hypothetical protein
MRAYSALSIGSHFCKPYSETFTSYIIQWTVYDRNEDRDARPDKYGHYNLVIL